MYVYNMCNILIFLIYRLNLKLKKIKIIQRLCVNFVSQKSVSVRPIA